MVNWSDLPEALLYLIALRLFSAVELIRFRSICTSWRSSVSGNHNLFPSRPLILLNQPPRPSFTWQWDGHNIMFLSRAAYFRVTHSSSPSQGWLIKYDVDINSGKFRLLDPFSRLPMRHSFKNVDLLVFNVSEIREAYELQVWLTRTTTWPSFKRMVLVEVKEGDAHRNRILGIDCDGEIVHWDKNNWRVVSEMDLETDLTYDQFSDIIVHKGLTYALDVRGIVWWISSNLEICRYGPDPILDDNITNSYRGDKTFVECCGELYIVDRLIEENPPKKKSDSYVMNHITVGFKVYKFDEDLGKMIEVKSLGDNAFVMATDTCFSVLANEFHGCLQNSIYFTEKKEIKVFKLDNGNGSSITTMSEFSQSCFQMFVPSFL